MDHRELFHQGTIEFKNKFRIKYYLNNVNKPIEVNENLLPVFDDTNILNEMNPDVKLSLLRKYLDYPVLSKQTFHENYYLFNKYFEDLSRYITNYQGTLDESHSNKKDIKFIFSFGDNTSHKKVPCFVKAKTLNANDYSVLLKLNTYRHIGMLPSIQKNDIPFYSKMNKIVWRGSGTGMNNTQRFELVKKFQNTTNPLIDIKFTSFPQNIPPGYSMTDFQCVRPIHINSLLHYKFLISIEGNDVSSNLKWILLSNSVVFQPIPKKSSWFMEDMLVPFKHYIPLKDNFSDLEDKLKWAMAHLDECEEIAKNATEYMKIFLDEENEKYITNQVIDGYLKNVIFKP